MKWTFRIVLVLLAPMFINSVLSGRLVSLHFYQSHHWYVMALLRILDFPSQLKMTARWMSILSNLCSIRRRLLVPGIYGCSFRPMSSGVACWTWDLSMIFCKRMTDQKLRRGSQCFFKDRNGMRSDAWTDLHSVVSSVPSNASVPNAISGHKFKTCATIETITFIPGS